MPTLPTILFSSFHSGNDPLRLSWARFREQVNTRARAGATASPGRPLVPRPVVASLSSDEAGIWRLLAPNNRELGRSSFLYSTFNGAREHVLQLRDDQTQISATVVRGPVVASFGWFLELHGTPAMTCIRWYGTAAASADAAQSAIDAFATAVVGEAALRTTSSGRRTARAANRGTSTRW